MTRLFPAALVTSLALMALPGGSAAQTTKTPALRAQELNDEGKALYREAKFEAAIQRFRQAVVLSPDGRFYFNLCYTLHKIERPREAITACGAITADNADAELVTKANDLLAQLRPLVGAGARPDDTQQPGQPEPPREPAGGQPPTGPTPAPPLRSTQPLFGVYTWSMGADLGGLRNRGLGRAKADGVLAPIDAFDDAGGQLRLHADFLLSETALFGTRVSANVSDIGPDQRFKDTRPRVAGRLSIFDLGASLYQHRRLSNRLWLTYLGGAHLALMSVGEVEGEAAVAFGVHAELALSWLFGADGEHELRATIPTLTAYSPASGGTGVDPADVFLDQPAATWGVALGYTYRFREPFGTGPIFTLE